jgi:radical SAM superfamily enzyme YgiQ (UPF0313 family)
LLYISAYIKKNGFQSDFYDLTGGKQLPDIKADIIAFSCQITQWKEVQTMREKLVITNPNAKFVIGGAFPTHTFCEGFYNIHGEGEEAFLQYLKGEQRELNHVDPNFLPDWGAIDLTKYGYGLEGKRCINIMTKRGNCPYHCTFCAKQEIGRSPLRFRTAENVLEEVDYLRTKGFGAVAIYDDDVLINKKRDRIIFEGLKARNMPYRCMTRTNLANKEDLKMLKDTGCAELAIGIESADPYIHEVVCRKGTTIEQDTDFVRMCKKIGLRVKTYLIFGLPSETIDTIQTTRKWLASEKPDNFDVSIFTPYPGSDIYKNKKNYDIQWDEKRLEEIWYSGEAQYGQCAVSTSKISSSMILHLKKSVEQEFKRGLAGSTSYWKPI